MALICYFETVAKTLPTSHHFNQKLSEGGDWTVHRPHGPQWAGLTIGRTHDEALTEDELLGVKAWAPPPVGVSCSNDSPRQRPISPFPCWGSCKENPFPPRAGLAIQAPWQRLRGEQNSLQLIRRHSLPSPHVDAPCSLLVSSGWLNAAWLLPQRSRRARHPRDVSSSLA